MNYVDSLNLFDVEAKEIPCIKGNGAPSTATVGAVGLLYMDTDTGDVYKCTAAADGAYTWVIVGDAGTPGVSPTITVADISNGHRFTITDADGEKTVDVMDGADGDPGVSVTHEWDGTTLKITSASGTSSADLKGEKGDPGDNYTLTDADKEEIAGRVNVDATTPDYIIAEAERVAQNVQAVRTARTLVFPALTDLHLYEGNATHDASLSSAKYAGMGIREMKKRIGMDGVVLLGDYSWMSGNDYDVAQVKADIVACKTALGLAGNEIWCIGNHDLNYGKGRDRLMTLDEMYAYIGANSDGVKPWGSIERGYGFRDFDAQKIRIIYLNTCDGSDWLATDGEEAQASWISPTQLQWLADTALDFSNKAHPSEWGIVLVGHHPLHYSNGSFGYVMELLEAYRDGLSGSLSCTIRTETVNGTTTYPQQKVTYDFSAAERAEIICNIHGHNHNCGMSQISSTSWNSNHETPVNPWLWRLGIPQICFGRNNTPVDSISANPNFANKYGEFDNNGNPVYWEKESGTAKATSFCVISIDRSNKKIYAHIFGAGRDRMVSYADDYVPAEYSITVTTENCTVSGDATTITEGESVMLTFVASDGYELPETPVVSGAAYDWNKSNSSLTLSIPIGPVSVSVVAVPETSEPDTPDEPVTSYTNRLPLATTAPNDNTIYGEDYNGDGVNDGYKKDTRYSSSSGIQASAGKQLTGLIQTSEGDIVRVKNIESFEFYIWVKSDGTMSAMQPTSNYVTGYSQPDDNGVYTFNAPSSAFIGARFSGKGITGDTIITVNEPIQ